MSGDPRKKIQANGNKKGSSSGSSNSNVLSLENSEPSSNPITLSALNRSSDADKNIKTGPKALLPGAVAQSTSASNGQSMTTQNTLTEFVSGKEGTKGSNYHQRTITSTRFISEPIIAIKKWVSPSLGDNKAKDQINTSANTAPIQNSEPSALPVSVKLSKSNKKMEIGTSTFPYIIAASHSSKTSNGEHSSDAEAHDNARALTSLENSEPSVFSDFLPDFIVGSRTSNISNAQHSSDAEAHNEVASPESEHVPLEIPQDNARYTSQNNSITTDTQGLVVATLVESNTNILGTDLIVDAIVVDDNPTTWYKDRRTLLIVGIIVVVAVAVSVSATFLILYRRNNESHDADSVTPSPTLPSTMSSEAPTVTPSTQILKALYDSTDGPNWDSTVTWDFNSELSYCYFSGIQCDDSEQITEITLKAKGLRGSLPSEIGMLSSLYQFHLDRNSITGTIPSEIGMLSSLQWFGLSWNLITGTIPSEIGMLSSLISIGLDNNSIAGTIPSELRMLSSLKWLDLRWNSITGKIPSEIGMLSSLNWLDLRWNSITGKIPSEIGMLSSLKWLDLRWNSITGKIPSEIGMLSLSSTKLENGIITVTVSSLEQLFVQNNSITGPIPSEIGMLSSLRWLAIKNNSITGHGHDTDGSLRIGQYLRRL